jgi:hypothetical protein
MINGILKNYYKVREIRQNIQGVSSNNNFFHLLGKATGAILKRAHSIIYLEKRDVTKQLNVISLIPSHFIFIKRSNLSKANLSAVNRCCCQCCYQQCCPGFCDGDPYGIHIYHALHDASNFLLLHEFRGKRI